MNKREKELLLRLEKVELDNLKIILSIKQSSKMISQEEIDYLLDKISNAVKKIEALENSLKN